MVAGWVVSCTSVKRTHIDYSAMEFKLICCLLRDNMPIYFYLRVGYRIYYYDTPKEILKIILYEYPSFEILNIFL